ncbi:hypothetical protein ACTQ50_12265 [Blautia sp. Sow4_E7]|uniref:hypothetical protein n=1 Tax=Blautia sp. Sow4_E7 TaxID=3438749 RepID=UPI003F9118C0
MAGVTIEELGLKFVKACMKLYWGSWWYPFLFAVGLLCTLIWGRKKSSRIFIGYTAFLFLTVYNPIVVKYVIARLDFENEYYRFIWILPVIPAIAYYGVTFVSSFHKKWLKGAAVVAVLGVFVVLGNPLNGVVKNFALAENIYKVPDELIQICEILHSKMSNPDARPRVVFDASLNNVARQYDAQFRLTIDRNASIYRAGSTVAGEFNEKSRRYKRQKAILDVIDYQIYDHPKKFRNALRKSNTKFVVVKKNDELHAFLLKNGCKQIAETESYYIYRYVGLEKDKKK